MKIFDPVHVTDLRGWLEKALEPICDADPEVLSDYVIALLKRDVPDAEVKSVLQEQLVDFTGDETDKFVDTMITTLTSKSYVTSSGTADGASAAGAGTENSEYRPTEDNPRKRRAEDEGRSSPSKMPPLPLSSAPSGMGFAEQPMHRSGLPRLPKGMCVDYHVRGFCARGDSCRYTHSEDQVPGSIPGVPLNMHGHPMPPLTGPPIRFGAQGPAPRPQRLEQRLGPVPYNNGPFGPAGQGAGPWQPHSQQQLQQQHPQPQPQMWNGGMGQNGFGMGPGGSPTGGMHAPLNGGGPMPMNLGQGGRGGGAQRGRGRGGAHGQFSVRRSDTTLVIENVPKESLDLIKINDFFKKFGTITNIQIDVGSAKALVSFAQAPEAKAAHDSPESIFGSRFVKCYFQKLDEPSQAQVSANSSSLPPRVASSSSPGPPKSFVPGQLQNIYVAPGQGHAIEAVQERRRLEAAQEAAQAKLKQLVGEQKTLLARLGGPKAFLSPEEKKAGMRRLRALEGEVGSATAEAKAAIEAVSKLPPLPSRPTQSDVQKKREQLEREKLDRELEHLGSPKKEEGGDTSSDLKAQLAKLKAEAASIGLDETGKPLASTSFPWRGAARGRGRGRGAPSWRGGGRRGAAFSLDNRTTQVQVTGLAGDADVGQAKAWFKQFGDVDSFTDGEGKNFIITYKARRAGESAIQALRTSGVIPDVGSAKVSWATARAGASEGTNYAVKADPVAADAESAAQDDNEELPEFDDEDREQNWRRS